MEESEIGGIREKGGGGLLVLPPPPSLTVAIAVKGNRKSLLVVLWALQKFVPEGKLMFKLFHVRPKITAVPTPMGNLIPISQVREDVADAYRKEIQWQTAEKFLPHKRSCMLKKVQVEVVQIESDDVVYAISKEVSRSTINKLVIGTSSRGIFSRGRNLSSKISECAPSFCTVYAVSNGKLSSLRPSDVETNASTMKDDSSERSSSSENSSSHSSISHADGTEYGSVTSYPHYRSPSLPMQRFEALSTINQILNRNSPSTNHSRVSSVDTGESEHVASSRFSNSEFWTPNSGESDNQTWISGRPSTSDGSNFSSQDQVNINLELEKLRNELRHIRGMYAIAQTETIDATRKINDLQKRRQEEAIKLNELKLKESLAKDVAIEERVKYEAAKQEAEFVMECAEREGAKKREAEINALRDATENEKLENALVGPLQLYHKFEWEEIVSATSSFSEDLKIGMGAYGTVYKCSLHHTTAAVKVLHSPEAHKRKQFQQELDILSRIRHPHLLILLGACPDRGCLVYEYMENGSLEDRLFRKDNSPPIPWFVRFRIAWEIASALVFLHSSKPKPIIHRDLKPANILLDHNFVSKIGDVGLSRMVNSNTSTMSTMCKETGPVGTLCYIDPEYQRNGLISPKSDVYALGMVILQLVTAKSALALTHLVETAVDDGHLADILDPQAGEWPIEETKELAILGSRCAELRRRDRPDLRDQVLPALERLKDFADRARNITSNPLPAPPDHFLCPILKDVMEDPCVASDGYTYDRKAIQTWLEKNNLSPMTDMPLPNMTLISNFTLLSAITQWKSGKH